MPVKIIKLISDQSGPFSASNNKVDITVPSYIGYSDLSKTCVVVNLQLTNDAGVAIGLFDAGFQNGMDAGCLIKNCSISATNTGTIESIAAANVLTQNMKQLTADFEDNEAAHVYGYETSVSQSDAQGNGTFIKKRRVGNVYSEQKSYLKIPLSTLFGIAKMNQFPNGLFGDLKISIEFEDDVDIIHKLFKKITTTGIQGLTQPTANPSQSINVTRSRPNGGMFYVGQPIRTSANASASPPTYTPNEIVSIDYSAANDALTFNLKTPVTWSATASNNLIQPLVGVADSTLNYKINDVDLVLYQWMLAPKQIQSLNAKMKKGINLQFQTFKLERLNMGQVVGNNTFHKQFDLEPNVVNVFGMMPHVPTAGASTPNPLFSRYDSVKSYRWRLNGKDTTNQDVLPLQYLYHDRLLATMANGFHRVKNLNLNKNRKGTEFDLAMPTDQTDDPQTFIIPAPIPLNNVPQTIQLRMHQNGMDSTTDKIFYLYKQCRHQVNLKSNQPVKVN